MKNLDNLIDGLIQSYHDNPDLTNMLDAPLPSRDCVTSITHQLESILYPGLVDCFEEQTCSRYSVGFRVSEAFRELTILIGKCLQYAAQTPHTRITPPNPDVPIHEQAENIAYTFFEKIPNIRAMLFTDLQAAYKGDPAACSYAEIILSYPGLRALAVHRLAHELLRSGVPILPRLMAEYVHNRTGIDIHPGAQIGEGFFIDHGTGVVIGETSVIGKNVKLYQGVTLGALSIPDPDSERGLKRHPTIEDGVTIYSGASILGGKTIVGARSVIGSNVWLTHSVSPDTKVLYVPPDLRFKSLDHTQVDIYYI